MRILYIGDAHHGQTLLDRSPYPTDAEIQAA